MATLTPQHIPKAGLKVVYAAAAGGGDQFQNNKNTIFHIRNDQTGASVTATFASTKTVDGLAVADRTLTVSQTEDYGEIQLDPAVFNDSDGYVQVTYNTATTVYVAVVVH